MNNYFMISEFAKLRDININSLRYYEKLGLLKPAYIDEKTGYRYYSPEQVTVLNKIILCINLGIPLKEMTAYIDEDGNLQSQRLLERGKMEAQKRLQEMQNNLNFIEISLKTIEANKQYAGQKGKYVRQLEMRKIFTTDYFDGAFSFKDMILEVGKIYKVAQDNDLFPILPAGQIVEIEEDGSVRVRFFLEIMNHTKEHPQIHTLPEGEYSCVQVELRDEPDLPGLIHENWKEPGKKTIIVANVSLDKYSFETSPSELQKIEWRK